jgi:hypothetical protein
MKKYRIPIAAAAIVAVLVVVYFVVFSGANVNDVIPDSAFAVIEINDWGKFTNELNTKQSAIELKRTAAVQKLMDEVTFFGQFFGAPYYGGRL